MSINQTSIHSCSPRTVTTRKRGLPYLVFASAALTLSCYLIIVSAIDPDMGTGKRSAATSGRDSLIPVNLRLNSSNRNQSQLEGQNSKIENVSGLLTQLRDAGKIQDPAERALILESKLVGISPQHSKVLLASTNPDDLHSPAIQLLVLRWASAEPQGALEWARNLKDEILVKSLMNLVASHWAKQDGFAASSWAKEKLKGDVRVSVLATIGHEIVTYDPLEALNIGSDLPDGEIRAELMSRAAGDWAHSDLDGAIAWAANLAKPELKNSVLERIALTATSKDLNKAIEIAMTHMTNSIEQDRVFVRIIERWGMQDPSTVASWVGQFPDDRLGIDAVDNLVSVWVSKDSTAPAQWVISLPDGPLRESGVKAYVRFLERSSPETAQRWANMVAAK